MLDAMVMGAFPIQSDTVSTAEWITHGENGLLVPPDDAVALADAIRQALFNDGLVDNAAKINAGIAARRLDHTVIGQHVVAMYKRVFADDKRHKTQ
jgi:glycosyltransferase involved in cell wall biosynthesis